MRKFIRYYKCIARDYTRITLMQHIEYVPFLRLYPNVLCTVNHIRGFSLKKLKVRPLKNFIQQIML